MTIRTDVPLEVDFESLRYRGASRERCYELFSRLAFRTLVNEYAPTADTVQKDYALVTTEPSSTALVAELRAAGEFAICVITRSTRRRCARPSSGLPSLLRIGRRDTCRSAHRSEDERTICWRARPHPYSWTRTVLDTSPAAARRRGDRQSRPRSQSSMALVLARPRHHAARAGVRFDARELSARRQRDPATPSRRRRSSISATRADRRGRLREGRQGRAVRAPVA